MHKAGPPHSKSKRTGRLRSPGQRQPPPIELEARTPPLRAVDRLIRALRERTERHPAQSSPLPPALAPAQSSPLAPALALLVLDLDRFKLVNDLCGHHAGDLVLSIVSDRYGRAVAKSGGALAHIGGDEFACVVPLGTDSGAGDEYRAEAVASDLQDILAAPIVLGQHMIHLTAAIGIAIDPCGDVPAEQLLRAASIAVSRAKAVGGATVRRFMPEMLARLTDRAALEEALRSSLLRGELVPYYQPIVALPSRTIARFELLARWLHPQRGLLGPDQFLPVSEDLHLIDDLMFSLLRQACRDARDWPDGVGLAINMSPRQVCDPALADHLLQIAFASAFPPERLTVEITEDAMVHSLADARATIETLRGAGVHVALDDFGTGYGSLARLCELPLDTLKIDRTLIQAIDRDAGRKLVNTVIDLGRSLGMPVTAEGVETEQQAQFLIERGCAYAQGFLFGRPAPAREAARIAGLGPWQT